MEFKELVNSGEQFSSEKKAAEVLKTLIEVHLIRRSLAASIRKLSQRALLPTPTPSPSNTHFHMISAQTGIDIVKTCAKWQRCDQIACSQYEFKDFHY